MITVEIKTKTPIEKVWQYFTEPGHIINWYNASDDWHAPNAENDLQVNGKFKTTMAAKDGSFSFDLEGVYSKVEKFKNISYTLLDDRKVIINFSENENEITITESFEPESTHPHDFQKAGWQAILNNFKKYLEKN